MNGKVNLLEADRSELVHVLEKCIPTMNSKDLASVLYGISSLKLPPRSRDMIILSDLLLERLDSLKDEISSTELSLSLLGLAKLGVTYSSQKEVNKLHAVKMDSANSRSNTHMPIFLHALPRVMHLMDNLQVANTIWAMGKIGCHWDSLTLKVQQTIGQAVYKVGSEMNELGIATTIHGKSVVYPNQSKLFLS